MKVKFALAAFALGCAGSWPAAADAKPPPLKNPALLNIGFVCRWQSHCIEKQERAMERALKYVRKNQLPAWKMQMCNRNAALRPPPRSRRRSG